MVYLSGDKLTERVAIHSPLRALGTGTDGDYEDCLTSVS